MQLQQVETPTRSKERQDTSTPLALSLLGSSRKARDWHTFHAVLPHESEGKAAKEDNARPYPYSGLCFPAPKPKGL